MSAACQTKGELASSRHVSRSQHGGYASLAESVGCAEHNASSSTTDNSRKNHDFDFKDLVEKDRLRSHNLIRCSCPKDFLKFVHPVIACPQGLRPVPEDLRKLQGRAYD